MTELFWKEPWLYFLGVAYAPVLLRLLFFFLHDGLFPLNFLNRLVGRFELFFGWMRDVILIPFCLTLLGIQIYHWVQGGVIDTIPVAWVPLGLSVYARWWRWHGLKPLQEFARMNPRVHPAEFFQHLYARFGFLPHRVPLKAERKIDPAHLHFKKNRKPTVSFWLLLHGVYDTFIFATLAYKAFKWKGAQYIQRAGSGLSAVWASRMAQLGRMEVVVQRDPELQNVQSGKRIYALNHKSFFDFCLAPLAYLKENPDGSAASFIPSIMVAKDHFKDNFFLYKVIGFGKMLEAWGMVFVDRKKKNEDKAKMAVNLAAKKLIASDMSFSVYPQGTRARGQFDRDGGRWDAGYFCVGRKERLKKEGGHFKKGVAYVAMETAIHLVRHQLAGPVWIIPVGMNGMGTACPKGALKVQTETKIEIKMGAPICIRTEGVELFKNLSLREIEKHPVYCEKVEALSNQVDHSLQQLLGIVPRLERRFFIDLNEILDSRGVDEVAVALKEWRNKGELVYSILDCVYTLPMTRWRGYLSEMAHLLRHQCSRNELMALKNRVTQAF